MVGRISLEGNIACSKSTLLSLLQERQGLAVYPEPVHEWGEWLSLFYEDMKRWSFGFQMKVLSSFVRPFPGSPAIIERSMLSTRHVFGQLLFNQGVLAQKEWDLFRALAEACSWEPDAIIFLTCPPETCLQRIQQRGRKAEAGIGLDYLHKVDFMYAQMLKYFKGRVMQIDGSRPVEEVYRDVAAAIAELTATAASRQQAT